MSAAVAVATFAACALVNQHLADKAQEKNPPIGDFLEIDGVRLHYIERGEGDSLLLASPAAKLRKVKDYSDGAKVWRAFARSTQKPFSALWKVTRSTRPARTS
jgi:hypothetical protein